MFIASLTHSTRREMASFNIACRAVLNFFQCLLTIDAYAIGLLCSRGVCSTRALFTVRLANLMYSLDLKPS